MLCQWKKSRKRCYPAPLKTISFKRPKKDNPVPAIDAPFEGQLKGYYSPDPVKCCTEEQMKMLKELREISPKAALLTCVSLDMSDSDMSENESTDTAQESEENTIPELLTSFFDSYSVNYTQEKLKETCDKIYKNYLQVTTEKQYKNLTSITQTQSSNDIWKMYRAGRITSSNCKQAYVMNLEKPAISTINMIMQYSKEINVAATNYGKESESKAFACYLEKMKLLHDDFSVSTTGLHVNEKFPFLGASPDGLTDCSCCKKKGLLEIKCPYSCKNISLADYIKNKNGPFKNGKINENHNYYCQMQLQMMVTERSFCDFFVWSAVDSKLIRIAKNDEFCSKLKTKLEQVFFQQILPELVTRNKDPNNDNSNKLYCCCKRPTFYPMIACDGVSCKVEWFHYSCVNLARKPRSDTKWYCPDCIKIKNAKK